MAALWRESLSVRRDTWKEATAPMSPAFTGWRQPQLVRSKGELSEEDEGGVVGCTISSNDAIPRAYDLEEPGE